MINPESRPFAALMASIGELYEKELSTHCIDLYWQALKGFDFVDVQQAFKRHVHNPDGGQFFPKPADIVRLIEGSGETKALQAWGAVLKAVHQIGRYESVAFDDALIHAVLEDMGGWVHLCEMTDEDMPFRAREFENRYRGYVLKKPVRYPKYLHGLAEQENAKNGFSIKPPLLIGNAQKAKQLIALGGGASLIVHTPEPLTLDWEDPNEP